MRSLSFASAVAVVATLGLVVVDARALNRAPPPMEFTKDGKAFQWSIAHGVTGGLILSGPLEADGSNISMVIACSGLRSGAIQTRFYEPKANAAQLRLRTADRVFRVYRGIETSGSRTFVAGSGDLPDGFFKSLASSANVAVEYAGQVTTFPGPGQPLVKHFHRYCSSLSRRAAVDE